MRATTNITIKSEVERRLRDEKIIWLTTMRSDGTPEPNPVWFLWDGSDFVIYAKRGSHKLDHIARDPHVSLNVNSDENGGNVAVFTGRARIESTSEPVDSAFLAKYRSGIQQIGLTPESFARDYGVKLVVTPTHVRSN